jgi:hypothetical protein
VENRDVPSGISPWTLGRAHLLAEVRLGVQAVFAFPAFGGVERDDMVAGLQRRHALAHLQHDARALMAEDRGEQPLGVRARQREIVGVADAGGLDFRTSNLARSGRLCKDHVGSVNRRSQEMHGDVMIRHRQSMRGAPGSSFTVK